LDAYLHSKNRAGRLLRAVTAAIGVVGVRFGTRANGRYLAPSLPLPWMTAVRVFGGYERQLYRLRRQGLCMFAGNEPSSLSRERGRPRDAITP
jgi:hypothetical protein